MVSVELREVVIRDVTRSIQPTDGLGGEVEAIVEVPTRDNGRARDTFSNAVHRSFEGRIVRFVVGCNQITRNRELGIHSATVIFLEYEAFRFCVDDML